MRVHRGTGQVSSAKLSEVSPGRLRVPQPCSTFRERVGETCLGGLSVQRLKALTVLTEVV